MATRVWIEAGCIQCGWCSDLAPEVFVLGATTTEIRGDARRDGRTSRNASERASLIAVADEAFLEFVADGCPVAVIKLEIAAVASLA